MNRLSIDFAPPTARRLLQQPWALAGILIGLVLCLAALMAANRLSQVRQQQAGQVALEQQRARRSAATVKAAPVVVIPAAQAAAVNRAVLQLNVPWQVLRDAIANATPDTVALLTLEPDADKHVLRITAEARTSEVMLGYVRQLDRQAILRGATLMRHEINEQDPNNPIRFQIDAMWGTP